VARAHPVAVEAEERTPAVGQSQSRIQDLSQKLELVLTQMEAALKELSKLKRSQTPPQQQW
jgi:hypothetical protein